MTGAIAGAASAAGSMISKLVPPRVKVPLTARKFTGADLASLQKKPPLDQMAAANLTIMTQRNTNRNKRYECDFVRVIETQDISRPSSPTPEQQHHKAVEARAHREELSKEKGVTLGPGDDEDYKPRSPVLGKRTVRWDNELEKAETEVHEPKKKVRAAKKAIKEIKDGVLDVYGNYTTPRTEEGGEHRTVQVVTRLFKGETDPLLEVDDIEDD